MYTFTPNDAATINDVEVAFSTERFLPAWEQIPKGFKTGNAYTRLAEAIFFGTALPDCEMTLNDGFEAEHLNRAVRAHLRSFSPKHEHKIAGVGWMIAHACTLHAGTDAEKR